MPATLREVLAEEDPVRAIVVTASASALVAGLIIAAV
jgi:hypothetical protein